MANVVFNLDSPRDDDPVVLASQVQLIGNMAALIKQFQRADFMVEAGAHNLCVILKKMQSELDFIDKTIICIRKCTQRRVLLLLNAFTYEGVIEELVSILGKFGPVLLKKIEKKAPEKRTPRENSIRSIQINASCIFIQLSYNALNIRIIEQLKALDYIKSFEQMQFQQLANQMILIDTILNYCSENRSIRL